jgi:ABC-type dipeptide/oligopeptide/nickel transport system ATPase subunit
VRHSILACLWCSLASLSHDPSTFPRAKVRYPRHKRFGEVNPHASIARWEGGELSATGSTPVCYGRTLVARRRHLSVRSGLRGFGWGFSYLRRLSTSSTYLFCSDKALKHVSKSKIRNQLQEVGFDDARQAEVVGGLSGGWKMKLELARAMLYNADLLLLDEVCVLLNS